jgi:hypothetical protein
MLDQRLNGAGIPPVRFPRFIGWEELGFSLFKNRLWPMVSLCPYT